MSYPQPGQSDSSMPQPGFQPPNQQYAPGYPPTGQAGYPPTGQPGYPMPNQQYGAGYPPPQSGFQPPNQQYAPGYPPGGQQYAPGYPSGGQQYAPGYPQPGQPGNYSQPQPGYGAPISQQPSSTGGVDGGWMNMPQGIPNCPPGLEYLTSIDQLLVHQKVELLEAFTGFETKNKFTVKNSLGQKVFYAVEDSDCCTRNCCGPMRPFDMKILDNYKTEVIHLNRPLACDSCCFPCCLQTMEISSPPGTVVGSIEQEWSILTPHFRIKNAAGDVVLRIEGPLCTYSICGDVEFKILSTDGSTQVGKISKQWAGLLREMFTDADYFGITFPMDLDVRMKAVMLGACFLIDAMFFEKARNQERDGIGML